MKGWKTKTGLILIALSEVVKQITTQPAFVEYAGTMYMVSQILTTLGGIMTGWGIAHKLEKAGK
jgi:hypothetical protein